MNPVDRDRGLRLVSAVTCAVAAASLVGIGATTALAANETQQRDAAKAADAAQAGRPTTPAPAETTGAPPAVPSTGS